MKHVTMLVEHLGRWVPAAVLWSYVDTGRPRALVRYETPAGFVIRQLRWVDELRPLGPVLELVLRVVPSTARAS